MSESRRPRHDDSGALARQGPRRRPKAASPWRLTNPGSSRRVLVVACDAPRRRQPGDATRSPSLAVWLDADGLTIGRSDHPRDLRGPRDGGPGASRGQPDVTPGTSRIVRASSSASEMRGYPPAADGGSPAGSALNAASLAPAAPTRPRRDRDKRLRSGWLQGRGVQAGSP